MDAIVFDFDGSILDTEWPEYVTVAEEFDHHGLTLELEQWQHVVGRADHPHWTEMIEARLGRPIDREAARRRRGARHATLMAGLSVRPGVAELIDAATERRLPLAVASSSGSEWVEGHLETLGLRRAFAAVVTRDHVRNAKPWPDLYELAIGHLRVAAAAALAIEDSHHGCRAAKAAGLTCVVVPNRVTAGQDFSHADRVLPSLAGVELAALASLVAGSSAPGASAPGPGPSAP